MSIRFFCPECKKPLEIDDTDGGKPVVCCYCSKQVMTPETSDPALVKPGEVAEMSTAPQSSATLGIVGLMAGLLIVLGFIVLAGWLFTVLSPETRSPEFIRMTTSQQQEFLKQKSFEMAKAPVVVYTHIAMNIVAVVGFICALAALVKKAGKKFAVPGLIITGIFLGMQLLKFLPKK